MKKRIISLCFIATLIMGLCSVGKAATVEYFWREVLPEEVTYTNNNASFLFMWQSYPASRTGETVSWGTTYEKSTSRSGELGISLYAFQGIIGYSIGQSISHSVEHTSASLEKGEYVKVYLRDYYKKTSVQQHKWKVTKELFKDPVYEIHQTIKTHAFFPLMPQVKFEYYQSSPVGTQSTNSNDIPTKTEVFTYMNGEWVLTEE